MVDYRLRSNAVCSIHVQAQTLLCGSPAQERCWHITCAHSLTMNTRHNNPIVSQRTCSLAGYERHNNPIMSQRACHWEDHPSSSSSSLLSKRHIRSVTLSKRFIDVYCDIM